MPSKKVADFIKASSANKIETDIKQKVGAFIDPYKKKINKAKKIGTATLVVAISLSTIKKTVDILNKVKATKDIGGDKAIRKARILEDECETIAVQLKAGMISEKEAIRRHEKIEKQIVALLGTAESQGYGVSGRRSIMTHENAIQALAESDNESVQELFEKVMLVVEAPNIPGMLSQMKSNHEGNGTGRPLGATHPRSAVRSPQKTEPTKSTSASTKPTPTKPSSSSNDKNDKEMQALSARVKHITAKVAEQSKKINDAATKDDIKAMSKALMKKAQDGTVKQQDLDDFKKRTIRAVNAVKEKNDKTEERLGKMSKLLTKKTDEMEAAVKKANVASVAAIALSSAALITAVCTNLGGHREKKAQKLLSKIKFYRLTIESIQQQVKNKTLSPGDASLKIKALQAKMDKDAKALIRLKPDLDVNALKKKTALESAEWVSVLRDYDNLPVEDCEFLLEITELV